MWEDKSAMAKGSVGWNRSINKADIDRCINEITGEK